MAGAGDAPDLPIQEAVDLYLRRKRPDWKGQTERTYRRNLGTFVEYAHENDVEMTSDLTRWNVGAYSDWLLDKEHAPATIASRQKNVRTWLKYLESQGIIELGLHLAIDTISMDDGDETSDQQLEPEDARTLLEFYRGSSKWKGTRRHALLEVTWHIGPRISCLRALDLGDYDRDEGILRFRNRPETGTRLKRGDAHERNAILSKNPKEALDIYIARERWEKRDDHGREPLFTSRQGRPSKGTIRFWTYEATQPCMAVECPHGKRRPNCTWTARNQSSKCPSSRSPHAVRRGSITWQRNLGFTRDLVAQRAATTPDVIRRYYDKPNHDDELQRRRDQTEDIDVLEHLHPNDLNDEDETPGVSEENDA